MRVVPAMIVFSVLSHAALAVSATCDFDPATVLADYKNTSSSRRIKEIVICQRANGSKYIQITSPGGFGDVTSTQDIVFENKLDNTTEGPITQIVALQSRGTKLSQDSVSVLRVIENQNVLEVAKTLSGGERLDEVGPR